MRKTMKKIGLSAAICALACCSFGLAYTLNPTVEASAQNSTPTLTVNDAKSIRVADDNHNGIRFTATIADYSAAYEYHMVIVPENYFDNAYYGYVDTGDVVGDLNAVIDNINTTNSTTITLNDIACQPIESGENYIINGSITNIRFNNSVRNFVAVAYAKTGADEETSADYVYSATSTPVNVTQLSAEILDVMEEGDDATTKTVLQNYIVNGLKKAAGKPETDEVPPQLSIVAENAAATSGESVALSYKVMDGENEVTGLDGLVTKVTSAAAGISFKDGKIVVDEGVLTRTLSVQIEALANALIPTEISLSVEQPEKDLFAPVYMQSDFGYGWTPLDSVNAVTRAYDETEGAMKATMMGENMGLTARSYILYLSLDEMKLAMSKGNKFLSFEVKGDEGTAIRIYNKVKSTSNNKGNEYLDDNNLGSATTAKIYRDVVLGGSEYTTVNVNLTDFMALNANGEFMGILVQGAKGANVYFKNASFKDAPSGNIFSDEYTWAVTNSDQLGTSHSYTEGGLQISKKKTDDNGLTGRYYVAYVPVADMKAAYESGKKSMTFYAKATASDVQIRVYAKKSANADGGAISDSTSFNIGVYTDYALTTEYTMYSIVLEKFFTAKSAYIAYDAINYIGIVIASKTVGEIYFKNATYTDEVIDTKDYTKENLFSSANASSWTVQGNVAKEFDSVNSALKVTAKEENDGYNQFTSNNRRIYIAPATLKDAYNAGYAKFTFEYNAAALTDPGESGNYGFRVYTNSASAAKQNENMKNILTTVSKTTSDNNLVTTNTWTKVEIDLATLFADGDDVCGMSIVVVGATDSYILFRNGTFVKAAN